MYVCWLTNRPVKPYECYDCHDMSCHLVTGHGVGLKWIDEEKDLKEVYYCCSCSEEPMEGYRHILTRLDNNKEILTDYLTEVIRKSTSVFEAKTKNKVYYIVFIPKV